MRYRLSVVTSLPASGWVLTGISCNGVNQQNQSASLANAQNIYLQNTTDARADCTFTFAQPVTSITVHKKGDRSGASVTNLANATFQAYSNSTYTTPVAGASCTTDAAGACPITGLSPSTTYYVRETTAPASFQRIDTLTTSSGGSQVYGQAITTGASGSNVDSRNFANRRINPAFLNECGINIGLVMDLSNSISDAELLQMKTSAKAFVTALQGTPSSVGGYTFATEAPAGGNSDLGLTSVSGVAGADTARSWIDNRTKPGGGGGGTNWDAGLRQVVAGVGNYDVVVFLTDGNPTFYGDPQSGGTGSDTTFREIEEGVFSVNAVKAANANLKMVGVAIGSDASTDNIAAISGPIPDDDYYLAANFVDLQNKLQQIASQLLRRHGHGQEAGGRAERVQPGRWLDLHRPRFPAGHRCDRGRHRRHARVRRDARGRDHHRDATARLRHRADRWLQRDLYEERDRDPGEPDHEHRERDLAQHRGARHRRL